jgi:hypothetical protein
VLHMIVDDDVSFHDTVNTIVMRRRIVHAHPRQIIAC